MNTVYAGNAATTKVVHLHAFMQHNKINVADNSIRGL